MDKGYYRFEVKHINRSTRNIVACASYRSDEELYSERTDEHIKFNNHTVQPESMILYPKESPTWVTDRERLWNEVDRVEKNNAKTKNPRLATEVLLSLPKELDRKVQTELTKNFVEEEFVSKGMIADVNIHRDDEQNPHAHVLLTIRPLNRDGSWGNKTKTQTVYDENGEAVLNKNGNTVRKQVRFSELDFKQLRKNWEQKLNFYAEREQLNLKYDSRSFEAQGRKEIAKVRLSRDEYRLEQREKKRCEKLGIQYEPITYYGKINQEIEQYNNGLINEIKQAEEQKAQFESFKVIAGKEEKQRETDTKEYRLLQQRHNGLVGYSEARTTLNHINKNASTFGRRIQNGLLKTQLKEQYLDSIMALYEAKQDISSYGFSAHNVKDIIQKEYEALYKERNTLEKKEAKRTELLNAGKHVLENEKAFNNRVVSQIYPKHHHELSDREKAYVVQEAYKGHLMHYSKVERNCRHDNTIPQPLDIRERYINASKDIFFSYRKLQNKEADLMQDTMKRYIEQQFIESKKQELKELEPFINDELMNRLPTKAFNKIEQETPYSKAQLVLSLDQYDNITYEQLVTNHLETHQDETVEYKDKITINFNNHSASIYSALRELERHNEMSQAKNKNKKKKKGIKRNNEISLN